MKFQEMAPYESTKKSIDGVSIHFLVMWFYEIPRDGAILKYRKIAHRWRGTEFIAKCTGPYFWHHPILLLALW